LYGGRGSASHCLGGGDRRAVSRPRARRMAGGGLCSRGSGGGRAPPLRPRALPVFPRPFGPRLAGGRGARGGGARWGGGGGGGRAGCRRVGGGRSRRRTGGRGCGRPLPGRRLRTVAGVVRLRAGMVA